MARGELFDESLLTVGDYYSRADLAEIQDSPSIAKNQRGVIPFDNCRLLLVDLDKQEYQNRFKGSTFHMCFQAQSTRNSSDVQLFEQGIPVYLFTRKTRSIKGKTQPYQYKGRLKLLSVQGEKPVQLQWHLFSEW